MMPLKILIVDDHQILLDSLSMLIASIPNMEVVGTLYDSRKVEEFLDTNTIDVLVSDMNMPYLTGIDLTLKLRNKYPVLKILMLTVNDEAENIRQAFQAGISGYVTKKANRAELERALTTIAKGEKYFSEEVLKELLMPMNTVVAVNDEILVEPKVLTLRELEIVKLLAQELSSSQIADRLFISVGTVENHRHNILQKLGVKNTIGVIKYAIKFRLI
jgi:DNA-binding NarL/FixJ family response regulator